MAQMGAARAKLAADVAEADAKKRQEREKRLAMQHQDPQVERGGEGGAEAEGGGRPETGSSRNADSRFRRNSRGSAR